MKKLTATLVVLLASITAQNANAQVFGVNLGDVTVGVDGNGKIFVEGDTGPIGPQIRDPFRPVQPDMEPLVNQPVQPHVVPMVNQTPRPCVGKPVPMKYDPFTNTWVPIRRKPVGNPVVGGQSKWKTVYDPQTGTWIRVRETVQNLETALDPNRDVVDPGSLQVTRQRSTDAHGNPIIVKTTYWTSFGKPHFKKQILKVSRNGVGKTTVHGFTQNAGPEINTRP